MKERPTGIIRTLPSLGPEEIGKKRYEASIKAICYEASEPHCDCICGGRNHGAGQQRAMDNTRDLCEGWIERYEKQHQLKDVQWSIPAIDPQQTTLF